MQILLISMLFICVLTISMFSSAVVAQTTFGGVVNTSESPKGGGYEGPSSIPSGKSADYAIDAQVFLSATPQTVGLDQLVLINAWITFAPGEGKYCNGFTVIITDPDGITQTVPLKSYVDDGTTWFELYPNKVGTYTLEITFDGEYFPEGYWRNGQWSETRTGDFANAIYNPSIYLTPCKSREVSVVTVQENFVRGWDLEIPTDEYWTFPVQPNMRNSWTMLGAYPWSGSNIVGTSPNAWHDNWYGPFIPEVDTPHIVWKDTTNLAGLMGGEAGTDSLLSSPGTPSVIYMGRAYQTKNVIVNGTPTSCATCYNIQTGELYYARPIASGGITPTNIAYNYASGTGTTGVELCAISNGYLIKVNPTTGIISSNISLPTMTGNGSNYNVAFQNGFYYSFQGIKTNTATPAPDVTLTDSYEGFLIKWNPLGTSTNFTSRIESNVTVTLPMSYRTPYQTSTYGNILGSIDYESMIKVEQHRFIYGGYYGYNLVAYDLKTGSILWNTTSPVSEMTSAYRSTNVWVRDGRYIAEMELGVIKAWDLHTGDELWELDNTDQYPWGNFWLYDEAASGDLLYAVGYTGVYAIDQTNGEIVWTYSDPAVNFETPYTTDGVSNYAVSNVRVIGGLLYLSDSIHTSDQPVQRGWGMICLNASTGEFHWKLSGTHMQAGAAAYGYLTAASNYDGTMYVLGKGESKTTVTAPQVAVNAGTGIVLTGTVLDKSPAAIGKDSSGIACVSDVNMDTWMDYVYLQMPIDGFYHNVTIKGVQVSLYAEDEHGNFVYIGEAETDTTGRFSFNWVPENEGFYTVTANFAGSNAYGKSLATTAVAVVAAGNSGSDGNGQNFGLYIACSTIVIVVVILLIGFLLLRKK